MRGAGVTADARKAVELFTLAAEAGYAVAQFKLGLCYECGDGTAPDARAAAAWFARAAAQGQPEAQAALARLRAAAP